MHRLAPALFLLLVAASLHAQESPLPDPEDFLREVRKRLETDGERQSGYVYVETRREEDLDAAGRVKRQTVKVFESYPGLPGERRWNRLVAENGRPVAPPELQKQDRERQKHVEGHAEKLARDPAKERARHERERDRDRRERAESIDEVFRVFDVSMVGRESLEGHETIVFSLTPRPGARPRTREGRIMRKLIGRAWISESDHELVRLDVEAIDTISIGHGLVARVHKGSHWSFQRRKVNNDEWLPALLRYSASARVGVVKMMRRSHTAEFSSYKKFNVDTSATYDPPKPPDP